MKQINQLMKRLLPFTFHLLPFTMHTATAQKLLSKKDLAPLALVAAAGYAQGWREEVLYHPNQLFKQMPNLNRNFWDIRIQNKPGFMNTEWDADHVLKTSTAALFVAAITLKAGEKKKWYWYLVDGIKYFVGYKAGFYLSYHVTHQNKL